MSSLSLSPLPSLLLLAHQYGAAVLAEEDGEGEGEGQRREKVEERAMPAMLRPLVPESGRGAHRQRARS